MESNLASLSKLNWIPAQQQNHVTYFANEILNIKVRPRIVKKLGPRSELKEQWLFSKSVYASYRPDSQ